MLSQHHEKKSQIFQTRASTEMCPPYFQNYYDEMAEGFLKSEWSESEIGRQKPMGFSLLP